MFSFQRWRWCLEVPPMGALLIRGLVSPQCGGRGDEDLMHGLMVDTVYGGYSATGCSVDQQQLFVQTSSRWVATSQ